jgi:hypothetical protein
LGNSNRKLSEAKLDGNVIISELMRNMELGRFEMAYTVLLPCVFTIYLNPEDHATLSGVFELITDDAKRALRAKVTEFNSPGGVLGVRRGGKPAKEFKIAAQDWSVEFLPEPEVPHGDVEIHSELNEAVQPGYRGTKTTLLGRAPSVTSGRTTSQFTEVRRSPDSVFAEMRYEDDSGAQVYLLTQNQVRVGRGGGDQAVDLALYTNDEVSREHLTIRRDAATGTFFVIDNSTNGTWIDGKRLKRGVEETLPARSEIGVGEVLTLSFEAVQAAGARRQTKAVNSPELGAERDSGARRGFPEIRK